jgi:hypothetical protein
MMISEIEALASREGMDAQMGDLYLIMGKAYKRMKDEKKARELGEKALRFLTYYAGFDSDRTEMALRFVEGLGT